jgi:hypothetical protein
LVRWVWVGWVWVEVEVLMGPRGRHRGVQVVLRCLGMLLCLITSSSSSIDHHHNNNNSSKLLLLRPPLAEEGFRCNFLRVFNSL